MTSKKRIQINSKVINMGEGLKSFVGRKADKEIKFMGDTLKISKLSVHQVMEIQNMAKAAGDDENANFDLLKQVIKYAADGGENLSDEDFDSFPIDDLSKLSNDIMKHSGMTQQAGNDKK